VPHVTEGRHEAFVHIRGVLINLPLRGRLGEDNPLGVDPSERIRSIAIA
jgi:hypothetical protein